MEVKMSEEAEKSDAIRVGRGPAYPWISLEKAVDRINQVRDANVSRTAVKPLSFFKIWGYKGDSGPARQTVAALNQYGLIEYVGRGGDKQVQLSPLAHRIIFDKVPNSPERAKALTEAALKPSIYGRLMTKLGVPLPPDYVIETFLTRDCEYSEEAAKSVIGGYKGTLKFAGLDNPDNVPSANAAEEAENPPPVVKIGDYVQWTSNGVDQFKTGKKVTSIVDGHAFVHGSQTGIDMNELSVVAAPAPLGMGALKPTTAASPDGDGNDISVLLAAKRLQITADVDAAGLEKLELMLAKYKEILKLQ
jgi:hypothetical protein